MEPLPPGTTCAAHPGVRATAICVRCGAFCCATCVEQPMRYLLCPACNERVSWNWDGVSYSAGIAALVFGALALVVAPAGLLAGIAAVVVFTRSPPASRQSRRLATAGLVLSIVGVVLLAAVRGLGWL